MIKSLNLRKFFTLAQISQNRRQFTLLSTHYPSKEEFDLVSFFCDSSQIKKLFEVKPPLGILIKMILIWLLFFSAKRGSKRGHSSSPSPIKETGRKSRSRSPRSQTRNTEYRRNTGNGNSKTGSGGKTGSSGRKRRDSTSSSSSDSSESDRSSSRHHRRRRRSVSQSPRDHRRR